MAKVFIKHNFSAVAQSVIAVWYENSAPLAEIGRQVIPAPHAEGSLTVTDLNPVMHAFKFYQSSDGVTLETLLVTLDIDAAIYSEAVVEFYEFEVGDGQDVGDGVHISPISGATEYLNNKLDAGDITEYTVEQRGFGKLSWGNEIEKVAGGGFRFLNDFIFNEADRYFITVYKLVTGSASPASITTNAQFTGISVLSANTDFLSTLYNKLLVSNWASAVGVIDIPELATIPNNTTLHLNTHRGLQRYVQLHFTDGNTIFFNGEEESDLILGKGEEVRIVFKDAAAYVVNYSGDAKHAGEVIMSDKLMLNSVFADGTEYNILDMLRLYNSLTPEQITTYAAYDLFTDVLVGEVTKRYYLNRGKFAVDEVQGLIKVPDYRGQSFRILKTFDGTADASRLSQGAGGMQAQEIISHKHGDVPKKRNDVDRGSGNSLFSLDENDKTAAAGGTEQRVDNVGKYAIVRI